MGTLSGQKFDQTKYNQVKFNMIKNVKDLIKRYGPDAEKVIHGRALKTALNSTEMKENRIREIIHQALSEKKEFPVNEEGSLTEDKMEALMELRNILDELQVLGNQARDIIAQNFPLFLRKGEAYGAFDMGSSANRYDTTLASIVADIEEYGDEEDEDMIQEDLDLGHQDNEPHMLKADLYKIGKYAMELYQMVDKFEGQGEVDFPHWWQAKIIKAASMMSSAKHYLEFELKEPQVDAMVDVASSEDVIDEKLTAKTPMKKYIKDFAKSDAPQFKGKSKEKKRQMAVAAKLSAENPTEGLAEIILNKLKNR
jgi:hypothetical protein